MRMRYFLLITCVVCLVSCRAQKEVKPMGQEIEGLVLMDEEGFSNIEEYRAEVIRDEKSLRKFYTEVNKTRKPGLPVPIIDFSKEMVVLVCLGKQPAEKSLLLSKLEETDNGLAIAVEIMDKKKEDEVSIQPIYYPFYLYKMPIIDKGINFQKVDN